MDSPSQEVQVMARLSSRDVRSNFGSNLKLIAEKTGVDPWLTENRIIKNKLSAAEIVPIAAEDIWRRRRKLLGARLEAYYGNDDVEMSRLNELIQSLTTS